MTTDTVTLDRREIQSILSVIYREQDRITLKLLAGNELARPHLLRHLEETKIALAALTVPEGR